MIDQKLIFHQGAMQVSALIQYDKIDPAAIRIFFKNGKEGYVKWVFGRDIIFEALEKGYAGSGDVRCTVIGDEFIVSLHSPEGSATLSTDLEKILEFTARILAEVPLGQDKYDVDNAIKLFWKQNSGG